MWVQDPGSSFKSSQRFLTNTLNMSYMIRVVQIRTITYISSFLEKNQLGCKWGMSI